MESVTKIQDTQVPWIKGSNLKCFLRQPACSKNHSYTYEILQPNKAPMELTTCEKVKFLRLEALVFPALSQSHVYSCKEE